MEKYSVLMSVYYKENPEYLCSSIQSMLDQTVLTDDFVVICDGTLTSELYAVLEVFQSENPQIFQIVKLECNVGLGEALNRGMRYCRHELIARMDSDDISLPYRCERQLALFAESSVDIVGTYCYEFGRDPSHITSIKTVPQTHEEILAYARKRNPFNHPCVMYKKSAVLKAGGYRPFYLFEDYCLWIRLLKSGSVGYNIPSPLLLMRTGDGMYARRGGMKYFISMVKFRWWMLKFGYSNISDFFVCAVGHGIICLLPNAIRKHVYGTILRKY